MKILLIDDHTLFLEGLRSMLTKLNPSSQITSFNNGYDALQDLSRNTYDVALMDLAIPRVDGLSLLKQLKEKNCLTPIIVVTASESPDDIDQAFKLGALGFIPKSSNGDTIATAIEQVLNGVIYRPEYTLTKHAKPSTVSHDNWAKQHNITPRQLQILLFIRQGLSNQEIASQLHLSLSTVKTHISAIFTALEVQSRTEASNRAHQLGLD